MLSIPENKIDEIRFATDIHELISGYVTLRKKGQNFFSLCPFHNEKSPSFSVNTDKQIFHCFGCGAGGNVFTFLMRSEGLGFPETVKMLAQRAGIAIDWEEQDQESVKQNEALFHILEFAAKWYEELLHDSVGAEVKNYIKKRGLSDEIATQFGLGFAPASWDELLKHAKKTLNSVDLLHEAGLCLKKENGDFYDRFRNRLIFPIKNLSGRVTGFGGRILQDDPKAPKYLNSPETPVYEKSKTLYGLFDTRDEIRRKGVAIFVEGYMDLLSLYANGIKNVVATSGTALTQEQAALIHRYTRKVTLMYDSDNAGSAATIRGADVLLENGLDVTVANLPEGEDPDSFVRKYGEEAVASFLTDAVPLFQYKVARVSSLTPEYKRAAIQGVIQSLAKINDRIQRGIYVSQVSAGLNIPEKDIWSEIESLARTKSQQLQRQRHQAENGDKPKTPTGKQSRTDRALKDLLRMLLRDFSRAALVFENLDTNQYQNHALAPIFEYLRNQFKGGKVPSEEQLRHHFNDIALSEFIVRELHRDWQEVNSERWVSDCLIVIRKEEIQAKIDQLRNELKTPNLSEDEQRNLLSKCMELERQKKVV